METIKCVLNYFSHCCITHQMGFHNGIDCVEFIPVWTCTVNILQKGIRYLGLLQFFLWFLLKAPRDNVKWCIILAVLRKDGQSKIVV